jgi:hypothetical protein
MLSCSLFEMRRPDMGNVSRIYMGPRAILENCGKTEGRRKAQRQAGFPGMRAEGEFSDDPRRFVLGSVH